MIKLTEQRRFGIFSEFSQPFEDYIRGRILLICIVLTKLLQLKDHKVQAGHSFVIALVSTTYGGFISAYHCLN